MTTKKIYGPWIKWHGGACPVPPDTLVEVKLRCGASELSGLAKKYCWHHDDDDGTDIVEYRTFTGEPDLEAAEKLLRDNGYTVIPPAKPLTFEDVVPLTEAPQEELHEYEWALYEMRGHRPSDKDNWHAGGTAPTQAEAEREAAHYLGQYANDDTGFRFEVFEVTRKRLGGLTPNAEVTGRPPHGTETE